MHKVILAQLNASFEIDENTTILDGLKQNGYHIANKCGGHAQCGTCIVKIVLGEDRLSEPTFKELQLLGNVFHITRERLACQTKIIGDVTIDISEHDLTKAAPQAKKKKFTKVRKKEEVREMYDARAQQREERDFEKNESWLNHWDKEKDEADIKKVKRLGGGKRPKLFKTDINFDEDFYVDGQPKSYNSGQARERIDKSKDRRDNRREDRKDNRREDSSNSANDPFNKVGLSRGSERHKKVERDIREKKDHDSKRDFRRSKKD